MACKDEEAKKKYHREYMRERRAMNRGLGLCVECGCEDAYTMVGRSRCAECAEKHNGYGRERRKEYERMKALREERREKRLCTECGRSLPAKAYPYVMCEVCRARSRLRLERKRRELGIAPKTIWAENGLCVRCGGRLAASVTKWGGEAVRLCERCYADTVKASAAGRASYFEKSGTTWGNYEYEYERQIRHGEKGTGS